VTELMKYVSSLFAFAVIVALIWWKVIPPVRRLMRERQDEVRHQLEESKRAEERLAEAERKFQDAVAEARTEAAKIRDTARVDADRIREEMRQRADAEVERVRQRGQEQLELMHQQAVRELQAHIGGLSAQLAERLVREHLGDPARRAATVDRFLGELEGMAAPDAERTTAAGATVGKGDA
jgi:F-type H+-transporting ATPase subunit b